MARHEPPPPTYLTVLEDLARLRDDIRRLEFDVVTLVRKAGATWQEIGDELGISRQAARSKYGAPHHRRPR